MKSFRKRKSTLKLELVTMINAFNKTDKMEVFKILNIIGYKISILYLVTQYGED